MSDGDDLPNSSEFTGFQLDLLRVIATLTKTGTEMSGQAIKEEVAADRNEPINHGRLYPNLDTLMYKGLIEKGDIDRRTHSYTLTDEGKEFIAIRHNEWATAADALEEVSIRD